MLFVAVTYAYSWCTKQVFFLSLLLFKKYFLSYFPGHGCFTNFRVNERYPIRSQKSFFYAACFFLACLHKLAGNYLNHFRKLMLLFLSRMFHDVMKRGFLLGNCVFIAVITILWKSASRVSISHDHYKLGCLLYKIN